MKTYNFPVNVYLNPYNPWKSKIMVKGIPLDEHEKTLIEKEDDLLKLNQVFKYLIIEEVVSVPVEKKAEVKTEEAKIEEKKVESTAVELPQLEAPKVSKKKKKAEVVEEPKKESD